MKLHRFGVEFLHNGDAVLWVYPWRRKINGGRRYYSFCFCHAYRTLRELDKEWEGYFKAMTHVDDINSVWRKFNGNK